MEHTPIQNTLPQTRGAKTGKARTENSRAQKPKSALSAPEEIIAEFPESWTIPASPSDLMITREPAEILAEAQKAAEALKQIISHKTKPILFNGEQYLEFEDWQTLGEFYGITAKGVDTRFVEFGSVKGFEARAVAVRVSDGQELSGAEAMCLNDERNWTHKPLYQLKSMAQTRACAKALRNLLAWVVVLAGFKPTPAEEIVGVEQTPSSPEPQEQEVLSEEEAHIDRFLNINSQYAEIYGPEGYKQFLHNSKGESPTLERIKTFNTPKQLAWLKSATEAMEIQLKG